MAKPFIYALYDDLEPTQIRYVGMAVSNLKRPYQHSKLARKQTTKTSYLINWIRKLHSENRDYSVLILEELLEGMSRKDVGEIEKKYIFNLRNDGHPLTNTHEGGTGGATTLGRKWTDEEKERMRLIFINRPLSESHKASLRHPWTETRRQAHKSHLKGRKWSAERRAAHTVWNKGLKGCQIPSDETRKRLSESHLKHYQEHPERAKEHSNFMRDFYKQKQSETNNG